MKRADDAALAASARAMILGMLIVAIAWIYVVGMAAIAEALSPHGTVLGAVLTFVFWGVLPLAVVLYVVATPARRKLRRQAEKEEDEARRASAPLEPIQPDGRGHAARGARRDALPVAPEREEP